MKEGDIEFSVLFADNDKIRQIYEVKEGLKSSRRKFVQCFPACTQVHSCDKFCGTPVSVVLTTNLKTSEAERCFQFDDVVFVAELRPIDANYTLQSSLSRSQLSKQIKQSGCLYTGSLVASTRGKQHNGDNTVQNGYYEFVLNAQNLPDCRRKESVPLESFYTFSVTVLVPLDKEEAGSKAKTEKEKENTLHPVAYFDSAPFFLKSSSGDNKTQISDQPGTHQPSHSEIQEAQSLISLYHTMQTERMALERRDLHLKLTAYANSKKDVPKLPVPAVTPAVGTTNHQHSNHLQQHSNHLQQQQQQRGEKRLLDSSLLLMPPSKQTRGCVPLELVTEDILEVLQESTALAQRPYQWQSHKGKSIRDPTVGMMRGLVQQSALEKALLCITKHNSILHGDISLADEEEGMLIEENGESSAVVEAATTTAATEGGEKAKDNEPPGQDKEKERIRLMLHTSSGTKSFPVKTAAFSTIRAGSAVGPATSSSKEDQSTKKAQETSTSCVPALGPPESEAEQSEFLSLERLKKHLMSRYRDPHAALRQRQCFSDVLQSLTKATWQVALRVRRAAERIAPPLPASPSTAFDLYLSVMQDSKKEHHNLTRAFLASDPPPLRALNWATRYLHSHGELTFRSSRISAQTVAAAAATAAKAAAAASAAAAAQSQPPLFALDPHNTSSSQMLPDKSALESAFARSLQAEAGAEVGTRAEEGGNEGSSLPSFADALAGETGRDKLLPLPLPGAEISTSVATAAASAVTSSEAGGRGDVLMTYIKEEKDCDNEDSFSSELDAGPSHTPSVATSVPARAPDAAPSTTTGSNSAPDVVSTSALPKAPLRDPAEILAQFKALLAADSSNENRSGSGGSGEASVDEAAPALALVALVSDYVCSGGCEKLKQQEQRAAEVRKQLHVQVETTHATQCALLQEAFLWESSAVSLENVGRSAEYFSSYRLTPLGPLIINQNNDNEYKKIRPVKVPISAEAAAAAAATHEALKREIQAKKFGVMANPDGPPIIVAKTTDVVPVEQPNPVPIRTKRSISNNNDSGETTAPSRPKRIRIRSKEAKQTATAAAVTGRAAAATANTASSSSGSSKPKSNSKKAKGKNKAAKAVKTVLAETRPLHRLTSMLPMAVGGRQGDRERNGIEGDGEGEGEGGSLAEEGEGEGEESDGNSLRSGTDDSASDSDSASLMSLASQEDDLGEEEVENDGEETGDGEGVV